MKVLIGYEMSGITREAFRAKGHDAWSCDLQETLQPGQHIRADIQFALQEKWDLAIFHPDCRYTCWSGERWAKGNDERIERRYQALENLKNLYSLPIKHIVIEQSLSYFLIRNWIRPTQFIHPYHFGEPYKKTLQLYIKNLPPLVPTNILPIGKRYPIAVQMPGTKEQSKKRSLSFQNIANAMADQWGSYVSRQGGQAANY